MVWEDSRSRGIVGQRFALVEPALLDVDADGSIGATSDGLLVLRSLFGFAGNALTSGAVGAGCNRCDATAIEPYFAGLGTTLDIDGNAQLEALTDGLLVLRHLFGFAGDTLVSGAVSPDCTRCDPADIASYLETLN